MVTFNTINFTSLYWTPIITSTTQDPGCPPIINPRLSLPLELTDVNPIWHAQRCEPLYYGAFDPPKILTKGSGLAPVKPSPMTKAMPNIPSQPTPQAGNAPDPGVSNPTHAPAGGGNAAPAAIQNGAVKNPGNNLAKEDPSQNAAPASPTPPAPPEPSRPNAPPAQNAPAEPSVQPVPSAPPAPPELSAPQEPSARNAPPEPPVQSVPALLRSLAPPESTAPNAPPAQNAPPEPPVQPVPAPAASPAPPEPSRPNRPPAQNAAPEPPVQTIPSAPPAPFASLALPEPSTQNAPPAQNAPPTQNTPAPPSPTKGKKETLLDDPEPASGSDKQVEKPDKDNGAQGQLSQKAGSDQSKPQGTGGLSIFDPLKTPEKQLQAKPGTNPDPGSKSNGKPPQQAGDIFGQRGAGSPAAKPGTPPTKSGQGASGSQQDPQDVDSANGNGADQPAFTFPLDFHGNSPEQSQNQNPNAPTRQPNSQTPQTSSSNLAQFQLFDQPVVTLSDGGFRIASQTLSRSQQAVINGADISVGFDVLAVNGISYSITPVPSPTAPTMPPFSLRKDGASFTIPIPAGSTSDLASLSAALPSAMISVLPDGKGVEVHGFKASPNSGSVDDQAIKASISAAFYSTGSDAQPTDGAFAGVWLPDNTVTSNTMTSGKAATTRSITASTSGSSPTSSGSGSDSETTQASSMTSTVSFKSDGGTPPSGNRTKKVSFGTRTWPKRWNIQLLGAILSAAIVF